MRLRSFCLLVSLFVGGVRNAPAQGAWDGFAWWNNPVRADLKLSDEQNDKIRDIVRNYRNRLLDARNNVQKAKGDLGDLFNDQHVDAATAKPVVDRLAGAQANVTRVFTEMTLELRGVLTLDQWRILVRKHGELQKNPKPPDTQVTP